MKLLPFLGQSEGEIISYCQKQQIPYKVIVTRDPRATIDSVTENRVIRLSWDRDTLVVLIGCFTRSTYCKAPEM